MESMKVTSRRSTTILVTPESTAAPRRSRTAGAVARSSSPETASTSPPGSGSSVSPNGGHSSATAAITGFTLLMWTATAPRPPTLSRRRRPGGMYGGNRRAAGAGRASWDLDVAHPDRLGPVGDVGRELCERGLRARGLDPPPEGVTAVAAGAVDGAAAQRAREAPPGRERHGALRRGVLVGEEERRHAASVAPGLPPDIGARPSSRTLKVPISARRPVYAGPIVAFRLADPVGRGTELERLEGVLDDLEA